MATTEPAADGAEGREIVQVPVVDVAALDGGNPEARQAAARQIDAACRGCGFFYAAGHGIDLAALEEVTSRFHRALDADEKMRLAIRAYNGDSPRSRAGYYMAVRDRKANESFCYLTPAFSPVHPRIRAGTPLHEVNVWPDDGAAVGWRDFYERFYREIFQLSATLLRGVAIALGRPEDLFTRHFRMDDTLSAVSLIRYPYLDPYPPVKVAADGTKLSFEQHRDVSLLTVLYQTPVLNLQALTPEGYRPLPPSGEWLLVNCGTYMEYVTRGYYRAPIHRVAFVNAERLSIPFFVHFGHDDAIEPFSPDRQATEPSRPLAYGDYLGKGLSDLIVSNGQT